MLIDPRAPVLATMVLVAYQDFRYREIVDWTYVPSIFFLVLGYGEPWFPQFLVAFATLSAASVCLYKMGAFSSADAIVLPLLAFDTSVLAPAYSTILSTVPMAFDLLHAFIKYGGLYKILSPEDVLRGPWVPKLIEYSHGETVPVEGSPEKGLEAVKRVCGENVRVHCSYGIPLAGYLAIGYVLKFFLLC